MFGHKQLSNETKEKILFRHQKILEEPWIKRALTGKLDIKIPSSSFSLKGFTETGAALSTRKRNG
jgi:hypothetical protein